MNKADQVVVSNTINKVENLMRAKKMKGLVVIPGSPGVRSLHAIEGDPNELVANIAFMAYSHPLTLEILQKAVTVATNRLAERLGPDSSSRMN